MKEIKRVGIYCRVSTKDQYSDNQLHDLRRYCGERGWSIVTEQIDDAFSGAREKKDKRQGLKAIMQQAREHRFDALLIWRYDRFARSLSHLVNTLEELQSFDIAFLSYKDGIDTATPQGKLYFGIMASLAEFELHLIQQRAEAGRARAKEFGTKTGRPFGRPQIVDLFREKILAYQHHYATGVYTLDRIADLTGCSRSTCYKVLRPHLSNPPRNVELSLVSNGGEK